MPESPINLKNMHNLHYCFLSDVKVCVFFLTCDFLFFFLFSQKLESIHYIISHRSFPNWFNYHHKKMLPFMSSVLHSYGLSCPIEINNKMKVFIPVLRTLGLWKSAVAHTSIRSYQLVTLNIIQNSMFFCIWYKHCSQIAYIYTVFHMEKVCLPCKHSTYSSC